MSQRKAIPGKGRWCGGRDDRNGRGFRCSPDDRGTALVTMIIVVLFVTILATTLLYISGMNLQIKRTSYNNKVSFYAGETTLEKARADFMEVASYAATVAYNDVAVQYDTLGNGGARQWQFNKTFVDEFEKIMASSDKTGSTALNWETWLKTFQTGGAVLTMPSGGTCTYGEVAEVNVDGGYIRIKDVQVSYTNPRGYTSIIRTDFFIQAPALGWDGAEESKKALESGKTPDDAAAQTPVDMYDYVQYVNWEKQ